MGCHDDCDPRRIAQGAVGGGKVLFGIISFDRNKRHSKSAARGDQQHFSLPLEPASSRMAQLVFRQLPRIDAKSTLTVENRLSAEQRQQMIGNAGADPAADRLMPHARREAVAYDQIAGNMCREARDVLGIVLPVRIDREDVLDLGHGKGVGEAREQRMSLPFVLGVGEHGHAGFLELGGGAVRRTIVDGDDVADMRLQFLDDTGTGRRGVIAGDDT